MTMGDEEFLLKWNDHHNSFFGVLQELVANETLTDVTGGRARSVTPAPPTNAFVEPHDYRTAFPVRSIETKTTEISNIMKVFDPRRGKDD